MLLKFIISAIVIVTFVAAERHNYTDENKSPRVANYFPKNGWDIYDFVTGFILGSYTELQKRAYDYDCHS